MTLRMEMRAICKGLSHSVESWLASCDYIFEEHQDLSYKFFIPQGLEKFVDMNDQTYVHLISEDGEDEDNDASSEVSAYCRPQVEYFGEKHEESLSKMASEDSLMPSAMVRLCLRWVSFSALFDVPQLFAVKL
jgi:hypothetical protein